MQCRFFLLVCVLGCGDNHNNGADARPSDSRPIDSAVAIDARPIDAPPDAPPDAACAKQLLFGGETVGSGTTVYQIAPATISYGSGGSGSDYTQLQTSTPAGGESGGQLLLAYENVIPASTAFSLEVVEQVVAVNPHNQYDSAAAIMGSLTGQVGTETDRGEMVYLDTAAVGWSDDSESFAVSIVDGNYHHFALSVSAAGSATFSVDGVQALTRNNYVTNGTVAVGDQTNDPMVDGTTRYQSVILSLCQ